MVHVVHITQKHGDMRASRAAFALAKLGHRSTIVYGLDYRPECTSLSPLMPWSHREDGIVSTHVAARIGPAERGAAIAKLKPDCIFVHEPLTFQSYDRLPDVPIVLDNHEFNLHMPMMYDSPRRKSERDRVLLRLMSDPRIVAHTIPSEHLVSELQREMRMHVDQWDVPTFAIHNGPPLPPEEYRPKPGDTREWLARGNDMNPDDRLIKGEEKFIIFCGNLTGDRRPDLLIATMAELQRRDQRWRAIVMSRAALLEGHVIDPLKALDTLFLEPVRYPWPWALDDVTVLDVCSIGALGFSFAEIEHGSWRGASPNKACEYSLAGTYQVADKCTWLSRSLGDAGAGINCDPAEIADLAQRLDCLSCLGSEYEGISSFGRRYAIDGPEDTAAFEAVMRCAV